MGTKALVGNKPTLALQLKGFNRLDRHAKTIAFNPASSPSRLKTSTLSSSLKAYGVFRGALESKCVKR